MRIIDRFSSEHDVFLGQLEAIEGLTRNDTAVDEIVAALRILAAPLLIHAENEEAALFPDLEPSMGVGGGPLAILTEEHVTIHGQIDRLTGGPTRGELTQVLEAFASLLRAHITKEEEILFPAAAQILGDERLARLDRDIKRAAVGVT
ncbi:MAG: hemerythrin domain-containing protein [Candidatus Limnocylindria bacterium]|nr:hemerythrin domain-containing protein [Candidatus Limnocylindria bacterium]